MNFLFRTSVLLFLTFIIFSQVLGQVNFTKVDNFIDVGNNSFISMASADMNNDNVDDIINFQGGTRLYVHLNNRLGRDWYSIEGPLLNANVWGTVIVDLNNDGYKEIVCGTVYAEIQIFTFNHDNFSFDLYQELPSDIFVQNINAVDINVDGYADLFFCNDLGENHFYINNKGVLEFNEIIDFSTEPEDLAAGNYASQFIDFDMDGDEDLYITKCSAFADDAADPRRVNQLYINDGAGNFTENGEAFKINTGAQSWASDFGDLDLDGDLDLIVVNHYEDLQLFENINNEEFIEVQENSGLKLEDFFFQVTLQDVDNDGLEDVILTEKTVEIYLNKGDFIFEKIEDLENFPTVSSAFSLGDYNHDGAIDIFAKQGGFQSQIDPSFILTQNTNENNWINFHLEGVLDTKDALGARMELYSDGNIQHRIKRYGRSYGVQFSNQLHFGLGESTSVDSVIIYWLNGTVETMYEPTINTSHFIKQNSCNKEIEVYDVIQDSKCVGQELSLLHNSDAFQKWNTGQSSFEFLTGEEGEYYSLYGMDECTLHSWKSYVEFQEIVTIQEERFMLDTLGFLPCEGEELYLEVPDENALWNDNIVSANYLSITNDPVTLNYFDNCINYDVTLNRENISYDFDIPEDIYEYVSGSDVFIDVKNTSAEWFYDINESAFHVGDNYTFENVTEDQEISILNTLDYTYESSVGLNNFDNANLAPSNINYSTFFTVKKSIILSTVRVKTNVPGLRKFEISDANGVVLFTKEADLIDGENLIDWSIELSEGSYSMGSNEEQNITSFNSIGPFLFKEQDGTNSYPFSDELGSFTLDAGTSSIFYFYYDWNIQGIGSKECVDGYYETQLKSVVTIKESEFLDVKYNSLVSDILDVNVEGNHTFHLFDSRGILIARKEFQDKTLFEMSDYNSGVYYMVIEKGVYKVIKQ